jgi:hypothetical protein
MSEQLCVCACRRRSPVQVGVPVTNVAVGRSWVLTASIHLGLRPAGMVWCLLQGSPDSAPARSRSAPMPDAAAAGIWLPAWTLDQRGRVAPGHDLAHRTLTNRDFAETLAHMVEAHVAPRVGGEVVWEARCSG